MTSRTARAGSGAEAGATTLTVAVACIGFFLITLDATVVNVALPTIGAQLHGDISALQWVVDSYTLVFAALMLSSGSVSDRIGASRAFSLGLSLFAAASAVCGLAPNLTLLVVARVVQGVAAAAMLPASLALVRQTLRDPEARAKGVAWWAAGGGAAVSSGPVVGGVLTSLLGWRSIFFINIPIGVIGVLGLMRVTPSAPRRARLDLIGQALAVIALGGLTFGVIEGGHHGFGQPAVVVSLLLFLVAGTAFMITEKRSSAPSIPLDQFRRPTVVACTATGFALNFAYFGVVFVLSVYFQRVQGASPLVTGLLFVPMTILIMIMNLIAGRLTNRFGARLPMTVGQTLEALGFLTILLVGPHASLVMQMLALIPIGLGAGTASPPMMTALLEAVDPDRAGLASGFLNAARQTGTALGVALFGALIAEPDQLDNGVTWSLGISAAMLLLTAAGSARFVSPGRGGGHRGPEDQGGGRAERRDPHQHAI